MPSSHRNKPYYSLREVRDLVSSGQYSIRTKARATAKKDFGWGTEEIVQAIKKLQVKHYHKTAPKYDQPTVQVDYYKAHALLDENIYIHFRIEECHSGKMLVICSFKRI